ncbi:MAG: aminoacetone oxidase family FAD-binding enzyme [Bacteroidetes bacterium HGW-Bacteroidetes-17]|nr:MAG: aminoacetone oxidase family FAD-binding enzyme [Bacteroidetes bacterium HGW-Bacteroidetes-17]
MNNFDVVVVGAGPAGLIAAGRAAELGGRVLLLEKMPREGRKLLITGSGRCNITNNAPIGDFITHVYPDGRFLRNAFSRFFSKEIIELLKKYGVDSILITGGRYFPVSHKSLDVLNALLRWIREMKVEIQCGQRVEQIITEGNVIKGVQANGQKYLAANVILATGGKSYPATGSTGEGYELARAVGHTIENVWPALVPLTTEGKLAQNLQGLNLKDVKAVLWVNDKKEGESLGEMIFTHFGLSGPIILTLSRIAVAALQKSQKVEITIDLEPMLDERELDNQLLTDINEHGKKKISNLLHYWLSASMVPVFLELLGFDPEKECHQISSKERKQIRHLIKNLRFKISGHRSYKEAIITAGGVSTNEISSKTMESKLVSGLYFAGEIIDLDAETGGYNLQIAYSTGWLAGDSCMKKV